MHTHVHLHTLANIHAHSQRRKNKGRFSILFVWTEHITRCPQLLPSGCAFLCISWSASFHIYLVLRQYLSTRCLSRWGFTIFVSSFQREKVPHLFTACQSIPLISLLYPSVCSPHLLPISISLIPSPPYRIHQSDPLTSLPYPSACSLHLLISLLYSSVYLAHKLTRNLPPLSPMSTQECWAYRWLCDHAWLHVSSEYWSLGPSASSASSLPTEPSILSWKFCLFVCSFVYLFVGALTLGLFLKQRPHIFILHCVTHPPSVTYFTDVLLLSLLEEHCGSVSTMCGTWPSDINF